jgi:16S rRNA pseudouridine516 synthase
MVTIHEGRYHQVKRMFHALGCKVLYLKRLSIGGLLLGDLPCGEYRRLTEEEIVMLNQ